MKILSKIVLAFMMMLFITGCIVTVNNNWGSDIHTKKATDDLAIGQEYEADVQRGNRKND